MSVPPSANRREVYGTGFEVVITMDLLGLLKAGTDEVDKARRELGLRIEKCPRGAAAFTVVYCQVGGYTGCPAKLFTLGYLFFCRLLLMQNAKDGTFI